MTIRFGTTRIVVLVGRNAVKLPNILDGWRLFLCGLLANMQERLFSRTGWPELCPVVLADPFGLVLVMKRARPMTRDEFEVFDMAAFANRADYVVPVEYKLDSFGVLAGRIVAVDYGS